jgi:hypothetical protein
MGYGCVVPEPTQVTSLRSHAHPSMLLLLASLPATTNALLMQQTECSTTPAAWVHQSTTSLGSVVQAQAAGLCKQARVHVRVPTNVSTPVRRLTCASG